MQSTTASAEHTTRTSFATQRRIHTCVNTGIRYQRRRPFRFIADAASMFMPTIFYERDGHDTIGSRPDPLRRKTFLSTEQNQDKKEKKKEEESAQPRPNPSSLLRIPSENRVAKPSSMTSMQLDSTAKRTAGDCPAILGCNNSTKVRDAGISDR